MYAAITPKKPKIWRNFVRSIERFLWLKLSGRNFVGGKWRELLRRGRPITDEATRRRHVREKSVIDHVARDLFKPPLEQAAGMSDHSKSTTDTGLPVEEQVRKEWDPSKGGLPTFLV
jgi:hypothetical protein